jgi:hypothetical protein
LHRDFADAVREAPGRCTQLGEVNVRNFGGWASTRQTSSFAGARWRIPGAHFANSFVFCHCAASGENAGFRILDAAISTRFAFATDLAVSKNALVCVQRPTYEVYVPKQ